MGFSRVKRRRIGDEEDVDTVSTGDKKGDGGGKGKAASVGGKKAGKDEKKNKYWFDGKDRWHTPWSVNFDPERDPLASIDPGVDLLGASFMNDPEGRAKEIVLLQRRVA